MARDSTDFVFLILCRIIGNGEIHELASGPTKIESGACDLPPEVYSIAPRIPPGQADLCNGATVSRCNEDQVIK